MDKGILEKLVADGLSSHEIARRMNYSQTNVRYWLKKYGLKTERTNIKNKVFIDNKKHCSKCKKNKELDEFYSSGNIYRSLCRACEDDNSKKRVTKNKINVVLYKGGCCSKCDTIINESNHSIFNLVPKNKKKSLNERRLNDMLTYSWEKILHVIDEYYVICDNCKAIDLYMLKNVLPNEYVIKSTVGINDGYAFFTDRNHPLAVYGGRVWMHRHVASIKYGRWIESEEHVHHIDENKLNNAHENLALLSASEHTKLHLAQRGYDMLEERMCEYCEENYKPKEKYQKYCCFECSKKGKAIVLPKDELVELFSRYSASKICEMYGTSNKTLKRLSEEYGIEKPKRGYWAKKKKEENESNKMRA